MNMEPTSLSMCIKSSKYFLTLKIKYLTSYFLLFMLYIFAILPDYVHIEAKSNASYSALCVFTYLLMYILKLNQVHIDPLSPQATLILASLLAMVTMILVLPPIILECSNMDRKFMQVWSPPAFTSSF